MCQGAQTWVQNIHSKVMGIGSLCRKVQVANSGKNGNFRKEEVGIGQNWSCQSSPRNYREKDGDEHHTSFFSAPRGADKIGALPRII